METREIGSLEVSIVGLGCNNFGGRLDAGRTASVVHAALDAGINFLDTADIYAHGVHLLRGGGAGDNGGDGWVAQQPGEGQVEQGVDAPPPRRAAELAVAAVLLAAIAYPKLFWWDDPITFLVGIAVGALLAGVSRWVAGSVNILKGSPNPIRS
jgi:hypothetical protein